VTLSIQKRVLTLLLSAGCWSSLVAQVSGLPTHRASRVQSPIVLDGRLDEPDWQKAYITEGFRQTFPEYGAPARGLTRVRILFDDNSLYVGARMLKSSRDQKIMARLNRRDQRSEGTDSFFIGLDPILSRRSAYVFGVTAAGVQFDFIANDSQEYRGVDYSWDAVWESVVSIDDEGWTVEMRLPLSIMKIPVGSLKPWGFNPCRADNGAAKEESKWYVQPRNVSSGIANYPLLTGLEGLAIQPKRELIPFVTFKRDLSHASPDQALSTSLNYGIDARITLPNNGQLDLAVQPDFGQVEVDQTIFNLSAQEISLPEKRPFFLEGSDIFQVGGPPYFYSRRIGQPVGKPDLEPGERLLNWDSTALITGAAKYTSKGENGLNIGVLGANTKTAEASIQSPSGSVRKVILLPSTNYGVLRVSQALDDRGSFIGGFASWVNRSGSTNPDALIASIDGIWRTPQRDESFEGTLSNSRVGTPGDMTSDWRARMSWLKRWSNGTFLSINPVYVGPHFQLNDLGYQSRTDEKRLSVYGGRNWDKPVLTAQNFSIDFRWNYAYDGANHLIQNNLVATTRFNTTDLYRFKLEGFFLGAREDDYELRTFTDERKKYLPRGSTAGYQFELGSPQYGLWKWEFAFAEITGAEAKKGFKIENDFQLTDHWKIEVTQDLTKAKGDYWFETQSMTPIGFMTGMSNSTPIVGYRDLTQFLHLLKATYVANPRLTFQLSTEWLGVNYAYTNFRSYVRDGVYSPAPTTERAPSASFRSWVVNMIARWEYAPGSTLFVVYGKNALNSDLISLQGGLRPISDLTMLQHVPSDDMIQIKISHLFR